MVLVVEGTQGLTEDRGSPKACEALLQELADQKAPICMQHTPPVATLRVGRRSYIFF